MKAIVFADRLGDELAPLNERTCVALLPVASKPIINYNFEILLAAGIREVTIVISAFAPLMRKNMGNGERWGIQLNYIMSQGEELPAQLLQRQGTLLSEDYYLILRGDILLNISLDDFLKQIPSELPNTVAAMVNQEFAGVAVIKRDLSEKNSWKNANLIAWPSTTWQTQSHLIDKTVDLTGSYFLLHSLSEYHQINLQASAAQFEHLVLPGTKVADGLMIGHRSNIVRPNRGVIGMFCRIHPTACLSGGVVVSNESIIDQQVHLHNAVIMPNTYVGANVELNNALVWGQLHIHFETDTDIFKIDYVHDYSIADLHRETFGVLLANGVHRFFGLILLLLSLPLWIPAALMAWGQNREQALIPVQLSTQQRQRNKTGYWEFKCFTTWEWNVKVPILRHLPKLISVVQGHLRLVGVSAKSPESLQQRHETWEFIRDQAPIGLLGPYQLACFSANPSRNASEIAVEEACYAAERDFYRDWWWLLNGLGALWHKTSWRD